MAPSVKTQRKAGRSEAALRAAVTLSGTRTLPKFGAALHYLASIATKAEEPGDHGEAETFPACSPPDIRTPPEFQLPFRRSLLMRTLPAAKQDRPEWLAVPLLACARPDFEVVLALSLSFEQHWRLRRVAIGDLSTTIGLAPGEKLTLEFLSSQRRRLEQTTVDSTEEFTSDESTIIDKEALNVARAASKTENWKIDGSGSFGIGDLKIGLGANYSKTVSESTQQSMQHITEATRKSSHNLKTMHKIEVRGVTEGFVQNRMTRVIENPYRDRTMVLNVYQLVKHFSVETRWVEVRPALVIDVSAIQFDAGFVVAFSGFLRQSLADEALVNDLQTALKAAQPLPPSGGTKRATAAARLALDYLFVIPNVFNIPEAPFLGVANPNDPATSFDARIGAPAPRIADKSGFADALGNELGQVFTVLGVFHHAYLRMINDRSIDDHAVALATALAGAIGPKWKEADKNRVKNVLDSESYTEVFRRIDGFLAMVTEGLGGDAAGALAGGLLKPFLTDATKEQTLLQEHIEAGPVLERLLQHLRCNRQYYVQRFLEYLVRTTAGQAIIDFANAALRTRVPNAQAEHSLQEAFDVQRAFVDRNQIVMPGRVPLDAHQLNTVIGHASEYGRQLVVPFDEVKPVVIEDVAVPSDGIHLEVAAGSCVLADVPPPLPPWPSPEPPYALVTFGAARAETPPTPPATGGGTAA
jgi:hypothetical protein